MAVVESMFSTGRKAPWHGLGQTLENPLTSEDAIKAAGLDWNVKTEDVYVGGVKAPGFVANVRDTDNSVLGIVTSRYSIIQNKEAFEFTDSLVAEGMTYETAGSLKNGRQIWLLGKLPKDQILGEDLEPYICFTNTHDGTGAVKVCMTPVRVVCQNTLNLALRTAKRSWSTRHTGDVQMKIREAQTTLGLANKYISALKQDAERMVEIRVTDATIEGILDQMYPQDGDTSDLRKARIEELKTGFFNCLNMEDVKQYRGTAYGAMMAATDFADHSKPLRVTKSAEESRFSSILVGHPFVDGMYKALELNNA